MTISIHNGHGTARFERAPAGRHAKTDTLEYRLLLAVCFLAFFAVAVAGRLMPWRWRLFGGSGALGRSVIDEALSRAHATAPYAFMC